MNRLPSKKNRVILTVALAATSPLFVQHVHGQTTFTYTGANQTTGAGDLWSAGTSWTNGTTTPIAPASGSTTTLNFASTLIQGRSYDTTNDIGGSGSGTPFLLNALNFSDTDAAGSVATQNILGNPLEFISNGTTTPLLTLTAGGAGTVALNIQSGVVLANDLTVNNTTAASGTFSGAVSGTGALIKNGAGTLTLSGADSYSGATTLNAGVLTLSGTFTGNGALNVNAGTLNVNTTSFTGTGASTVNGGTLAIGGSFAGTGAITVNGGSTFTITGTDSGTSSVTVNSGTLSMTAAGALNSSATVTLGALAAGTSGALTDSSTGTQTLGSTIISAPGTTISNTSTGTLNLGGITPSAGGTVNFTSLTGTTTTTNTAINGILGGYATVTNNTWAAVGTGGAITGLTTYTTTATAGTTPASYTNANIDVTASAAPTAAITPNTLRFNTASTSYTLTLTGANTIGAGGVLQTSTANVAESVTGGTLTSGTNYLVLSNYYSNTAAGLTIASNITDNTAGAVGLTTVGSGTGLITLSGANTYSGPTVLSGPRVSFSSIGNVNGTVGNSTGATGSSFGIPATGNGTITVVGSLQLLYTGASASSDRPFSLVTPGATVSFTAASGLTLSGGITGNNASLGFNIASPSVVTETGSISLGTGSVSVPRTTVTLGSAGSTLSYSGTTTVSGGTLTINGTDNRTGTTTVSGGTLLLNGAPSSGTAAAGAVSVTSGTLGGTGSLAGATTVSSGAFITGGTKGTAGGGIAAGQIGMLSLTSSLTLASGSTFQVDLSTNSADKLAITGSLLSSGATLSFVQDVSSGTLASGTYVIATYASDTGSTFATSGLPTGFSLVDTGTQLEITTSSVPEPSTFVLPSLLTGWLLLVIARRRKAQAC